MILEKLVKRVLAPLGIKFVRARTMRDPNALLLLKSREMGVETILDVGANVGQFVQTIRAMGYDKRAVSFEPTSEAHALLVTNAASDPTWIAAPRMALGAQEGEAEIGVSANSASSSLLAIEAGSTDVLPITAFIARETVTVRRLDSVVGPHWPGPYALKLDTQGFELEVLRGAPETLRQTRVLTVELTLGRLYSGGARIGEVFSFLEAAGMRAIAVTEGFSDIERNEMLQVDAVFVRDA
jgi:FkbM family methyltransferase